MTGIFDGIQIMLNKHRGGHVQSRGRALKSISKERVESIVTSVDDCYDNRARLLKIDVPPILPLGKQNLLVGFQSSSSDDVDEESCPFCVINRGQIVHTTVCMPTALRGSQTQVQVIHHEASYRKAISLQDEGEEIENDLPREEGDVTMLLIIMCTS